MAVLLIWHACDRPFGGFQGCVLFEYKHIELDYSIMVMMSKSSLIKYLPYLSVLSKTRVWTPVGRFYRIRDLLYLKANKGGGGLCVYRGGKWIFELIKATMTSKSSRTQRHVFFLLLTSGNPDPKILEYTTLSSPLQDSRVGIRGLRLLWWTLFLTLRTPISLRLVVTLCTYTIEHAVVLIISSHILRSTSLLDRMEGKNERMNGKV